MVSVGQEFGNSSVGWSGLGSLCGYGRVVAGAGVIFKVFSTLIFGARAWETRRAGDLSVCLIYHLFVVSPVWRLNNMA